jgi:aminoglycoside phosphotransferase (APT) family kinase protein
MSGSFPIEPADLRPLNKQDITAAVAAALVAEQLPQWAHLPVRPVAIDGNDNTSFRLGADMLLRLPSHERYVPGVHKEHRWLPVLARALPLPIPETLFLGQPGCGFPRPWSVYRWLDGEPASVARIDDRVQFARDVASFLAALYSIDPTGGPPPGEQNFFRGAPLAVYDADTRVAIDTLRDDIDTHAATAMWQEALDAEWTGKPVWFHGDVAENNLLVIDGRLCAVIDFGTSGIGDPACDAALAWTFLSGAAREEYRARLPFDDATWQRGRGWALWKALITTARRPASKGRQVTAARRVLAELLAER